MNGAAGLPAIAMLWLGMALFAAALVVARWRREAEAGGKRDPLSLLGIAVQGAAFVVAATGGTRVVLDPLGAIALIEAGVVAALMASALTLFVWATRTMGRNWSLVARTRSDHALVTTGPFAHIRHPIYTALALVVIALAVALGHDARLLVALPLYALGTWLRVRIEERLLATMFGSTYRAYALRVKRFVPGIL